MPGPNWPYSQLSANQTETQAFEESKDAHRVDIISGTTPVGPTNPLFTTALPFKWDYVSMALSNANTTETYSFKIGGSGGTPTGTIVINYTSNTRDVLMNVTITVI